MVQSTPAVGTVGGWWRGQREQGVRERQPSLLSEWAVQNMLDAAAVRGLVRIDEVACMRASSCGRQRAR